MKHFLKRLAAGAVALALSTGVASALPVLQINAGLDAGTPKAGPIPGGSSLNDALNPLFGLATLGGYYGSTISLSGDAELKITLLGAEAGYENQFKWLPTGATLTNLPGINNFSAGGVNGKEGISSFFVSAVSGDLSFSFKSLGLVPSPNSVTNGFNPDGSVLPGAAVPNFFASFGPTASAATSGDTLYLFFDDKPDERTDDNHDDLVIKVQVVPLPAAAWLLLGVSGALVAAKRRSNRRAA